MGLIDIIRKLMAPAAAVTGYQETQRQGKYRPTDYAALVARNESWVYKCASLNAAAMASTELELYTKAPTSRYPTRALTGKRRKSMGPGSVEIEAHPLLDVLSGANPQQTGHEALYLTALYLELVGNAYWYVDRENPLRVPTAIYPLMAQYVKIVKSGEGAVIGYVYGTNSQNQQAYDASEIIHFRYPNPADPDYGIGPLQAAIKPVDRGASIAEYAQAFFDNSARVDFAIKVPAGTPAAERDAVLATWMQKYSGKRKSHKPAVLSGDMSLETFSYSPADNQALINAQYSRDEILAMFGVPKSFVETTQSRAEAEAQQFTYAKYTLEPRLKFIESTLNEMFVPMFDDTGALSVGYDDIVPENEESESVLNDRALKNWSVTVNEVRADCGKPPVDWGEVPLTAQGYSLGSGPTGLGLVNTLAASQDAILTRSGEKMTSHTACTCDHCKSLPAMTKREKELHDMAARWVSGMRAETLGNINARA